MFFIYFSYKNDLIFLIFITIFVFLFLLEYDIPLYLSLLIIIFFFLFFLGLILKKKRKSPSSLSNNSNINRDSRIKDNRKIEVKYKRTIRPDFLEFNYQKPLVNKCPNCGFITTNYMKKCPSCKEKL